ncbi:hypothetical protein, partial [Neisseria meningitidis]|uniref:hypothetical protein n=1 Tax=Neisseria meningitidis TaxID=487 RepID=UPI00195DD07F
NLHPVIPSKTENQNQKPKIPSFPHKRESKNKKSQKFNGRTEPRKSASRLRLNNRTKEAEIKTSGFFF